MEPVLSGKSISPVLPKREKTKKFQNSACFCRIQNSYPAGFVVM